MNTCHLLFLVAGLSVAQARSFSIGQFRSMMLCTMPDSWPLFDYSDYGCHCGVGGSGPAVDETDRCCQVHDQCYRDAIDHSECWWLVDHPYTEHYFWSCDKANKTATCNGGKNDACEQFICECDKIAADCFAVSKYNPENARLPSDRCRL